MPIRMSPMPVLSLMSCRGTCLDTGELEIRSLRTWQVPWLFAGVAAQIAAGCATACPQEPAEALLIFSRAPQIFIWHQRRRPFFEVSRNSQSQSGVAQALSRAISPEVSN